MPSFLPKLVPLDAATGRFDDLSAPASQRIAFHQSLSGSLLPTERTTTLDSLAQVDPLGGAQAPAARRLPWFLPESTWDAAAVTARRWDLVARRAPSPVATTASGP